MKVASQTMASIRKRIIRMHPLLEDLIRILECCDSSVVLPVREGLLRKSASRALELSGEGWREYDLNNYEEAFQLFNRSIATAPPNSEELAMAYHCRSGLALDLESFEFCLLNANRALSGPLPETTGQEAVENKLECWERLQCKHNSSEGLERVDDSSHEIRLSADLPCPKSRTCRIMRIDLADITPDNLPPRDPLWDTKLKNPLLLPNVSTKIKIEENLQYGRHLLASEDIEPGEILWIQDYFSMVAMEEPEFQFSHCAYCTSWCEALIPCLACTEEMYCSLHCQKSAYDAYHRTECKLLTFLPKPLCSSARIRLSLRIFLTGTKQGADLNKLMNDPKVFKILEEESNCVGVPYITNDYLAILNLWWRDIDLYADSWPINHKDCRTVASRPVVQKENIIPGNDGSTTSRNGHSKFENNSIYLPEEHPSPDDTRFTFLAIFSALKRIGFFDEKIHTIKVANKLTEAELLACVLLLQNLLVLRKNYGFIHSFCEQPETTAEQETGWIQLGSIADLMSHSCDPNTATLKYRRQILTYSLRPIKAGEQLFTHYEYCFCWNSLEERQEYLKNYYSMVCRCPACVHNWPLEESLRWKSIEFLKPHKINLEDMLEIYEWCKKSDYLEMKESINVHDLEKAFQYSKIIHEYIEQPSIITSVCERYIRRIMNKKSG